MNGPEKRRQLIGAMVAVSASIFVVGITLAAYDYVFTKYPKR